MRQQWINRLKASVFLSLSFLAGGNAMAYPEFKCAYEKDHNPPLDAEADRWFQEARRLEKTMDNWPRVVTLYTQAAEKNHWKAMHNLARLFRTGWPGNASNPGIEEDQHKMLDLYKRMVELRVPLGYYNWAVVAERGAGILKSDRMASSYMYQAAQLGSPLAQIRLGRYFAYDLPRDKRDNQMAELYFRCAGKQENTEAIIRVASFYQIAKLNKPRALFYYQRAASLGSDVATWDLKGAFNKKSDPQYAYGYEPDEKQYLFYVDLEKQIDADPSIRFPNLATDRPLPKHPTQGYDREHPDQRPEL